MAHAAWPMVLYLRYDERFIRRKYGFRREGACSLSQLDLTALLRMDHEVRGSIRFR